MLRKKIMYDINKLNNQINDIEACAFVHSRSIGDKNITDWKCITDKGFKKKTNYEIHELILGLKEIELDINEKKDLIKQLFNYRKIKKLIKKLNSEMNKMNKLSNKIKSKKMKKKIPHIKCNLKDLKTLLTK